MLKKTYKKRCTLGSLMAYTFVCSRAKKKTYTCERGLPKCEKRDTYKSEKRPIRVKRDFFMWKEMYGGITHCVDARCVLQCVAEECVAVCCSVLQCVAVCCSVLQCVAVSPIV